MINLYGGGRIGCWGFVRMVLREVDGFIYFRDRLQDKRK